MGFSFRLHHTDGAARAGEIATAHGKMSTPAFMPVATQATVKGLLPEEVAELGAAMVLCNAYHLYLRPGVESVARLGGLHSFMGWSKPILSRQRRFPSFQYGRVTQDRRRWHLVPVAYRR